MSDVDRVLKVEDLRTEFHTLGGVVRAVNGVSFHLNRGEVLGVVGESGCGKSVSMMSLLQLIPNPPGRIVDGTALLGDRDLLAMSQSEIREVRSVEIGMIFQDPMTSLNPVLTIGTQIAEPLVEHKDMSWDDALEQSVELLDKVGIPDAAERINDYPHQFSGGMRQRVMIAIALACSPPILIADEPTTALDVTIQAQILELLNDLRHSEGMGMILITHDLGVIARLADRVAVMYAGQIVETGSAEDVYANPSHPYTQGLLESLPRHDQEHSSSERLTSIDGQPPNMLDPIDGCPFAMRCKYVFDRCKTEDPNLIVLEGEHSAACWWDIKNECERTVE
ncbi:MAG TPA: peptide ABC transporter ATP-binding protein [Chloroflexi bacterium]|nr:peptide ABC transporter ATP-binding protein [Chloroflexota bacterium]|tara:strand:+ start:1082 stop:2092 length:1011 start_codon:yes stop_codon:yes gene_type:complete